MSNFIYDEELYNRDVKQLFLDEYKANTQKTLLRLFKVSQASERDRQQDLYDFNREQVRKLLYMLKPTKFNASKQNGALISMYMDWAIEQGYRKSINPLDGISKDWYNQFVDTNKVQYFTEDRLNEMIRSCENTQDAVIVRLLMEGAGGEANEELLNLRKQDIDFTTNMLMLRDLKRREERILRVSDRCIDLCGKALAASTYEKKNGISSPNTKSPTVHLVENEFVIRSSVTNTENVAKADKNIIHRRMAVLSQFFNEPYFTPLNIRYSGMLMMARDLVVRYGELGPAELNKIAERFHVSRADSTGDQNMYRLKEEFLNITKLNEMYEIPK